MHEQDGHCGCGCGCGHDHGQEHEHHHHHHGHEALTEAERAFLHELEHHHYLPVARFLSESSREADYSVVALAPVYLRHKDETMEWVKETGAMLRGLEEKAHRPGLWL